MKFVKFGWKAWNFYAAEENCRQVISEFFKRFREPERNLENFEDVRQIHSSRVFFFSYVRTSQVIKIVKNETGLAREEFTIRFIEAFEFLTCNIWYKVSSYRKMISICYMQSRWK